MSNGDLKSVLIHGTNLEYHLFQIAINFAEQGMNVWFISPERFESLPFTIKIPEKSISKLITFLYLNNHSELLKHTNEIHTWHRIPNVIIISKLNEYLNIDSEISSSIFIACNLIDAANTCSNRHSRKAYLIASYNEIHENDKVLKTLIEIYNFKSYQIEDGKSFPINVIL